MLLVYIFFAYFLNYIDCYQTTCPSVNLPHGRTRYSPEGNSISFKCNRPYVLLGDDTDYCRNGTWAFRNQICARKDCPKLPKLLHGHVSVTKKAFAKSVCDSNFVLIGSPALYCTEKGWNDTLPSCEANSLEKFKPCHFEIDDPEHCHWLLKPSTFKWTIYPSSKMQPDSVADDFPLYDHTLAPHIGGHYLLLIQNFPSKSAPDQNVTEAAQFISPQFPPTIQSNESLCLIFFYYVSKPYGAKLRVLINNDTAWENTEQIDRTWTKAQINLQNQPYSFRIILEGVKNLQNRSSLAIDDLKLATGEACGNYDTARQIPLDSYLDTRTLSSTTTTESTSTTEMNTVSTTGNSWTTTYETPGESFEDPFTIDLETLSGTTVYIFSLTESGLSASNGSSENADELSKNINLTSAINTLKQIDHSINFTSSSHIQSKVESNRSQDILVNEVKKYIVNATTHVKTSTDMVPRTAGLRNSPNATTATPKVEIISPISTVETKKITPVTANIYNKTKSDINKNVNTRNNITVISARQEHTTTETHNNNIVHEEGKHHGVAKSPKEDIYDMNTYDCSNDESNDAEPCESYTDSEEAYKASESKESAASQPKSTIIGNVFYLFLLISLVTAIVLLSISRQLYTKYKNKRANEWEAISFLSRDRNLSVTESSASFPLAIVTTD